jgi:hypothetical protein
VSALGWRLRPATAQRSTGQTRRDPRQLHPGKTPARPAPAAASKGTFVLAKNHGLLWLLKTPLQQDYRITDQGIARRDANGWQMLPNKSAGAEQNRLFLAVLQGDSSGCNGISNCR